MLSGQVTGVIRSGDWCCQARRLVLSGQVTGVVRSVLSLVGQGTVGG